MKSLLIVGATPPPVHGCSIAIRFMLDGDLSKRFRVLHLDIADRRNLDNLGRFDITNVLLGLKHGLQFVSMLLRERPDVVYLILSQNRWAFLRDLVFILPAMLTGTPFVAHLHGGRMPSFLQETDGVMRSLVRWVLRKATRVLVLGETLRDELVAACPDVRVTVVPNGVPDIDTSLRSVVSNAPMHVVYIGSLTSTKGVLDLLHAALRLDPFPIRFTFAGEPVGEDVKRAIAEAKIRAPDRVRFAGVVEETKKGALLASGDVFVFPTYYEYEGHPLALLEAMAAGLAIVTTNWRSIQETVRHEQEALIVAPRDAGAIEAALERLLREPETRARLGQAARARYLEQYTLAHWTDRMAAVFDGVLTGQNAAEFVPETGARG